MKTEAELQENDPNKPQRHQIVSGPGDAEFKEALYAWPDPAILRFRDVSGADNQIVLNGVGRTNQPDEWRFFANRVDEERRIVGRLVGRYSPQTGEGVFAEWLPGEPPPHELLDAAGIPDDSHEDI